MANEPKQSSEHSYPPTRELWSVLGVALAGGVLWLAGGAVHNISIGMLDDPVVGCNSVGCAPSLISFVSLILYGVALLALGFAYLGLLSFVRRPLAIALMILGGLGIVVALAGLVAGYDYRTVDMALIISPVALLSGIFAFNSGKGPAAPRNPPPRGR
ncbi:MAG: hypothetical protein WD751_06320 [Anaerolineales bacterium]